MANEKKETKTNDEQMGNETKQKRMKHSHATNRLHSVVSTNTKSPGQWLDLEGFIVLCHFNFKSINQSDWPRYIVMYELI